MRPATDIRDMGAGVKNSRELKKISDGRKKVVPAKAGTQTYYN